MEHKGNSPRNLTRREVLKYGLYGGVAGGLSSSLWLSGCGIKQRRKKPSIILITVDTVRPDHLGCYGYSKNTSPNIDQFAEESMLFENCISHGPETRTSFASIFSGFLPHEARVFEPPMLPVPNDVEMLAEILQRSGYKTVAVVSNYILRKRQGYEQGFMIYDDTMDQHELVRRWPERIAEHTTDRAVELLKQFQEEPLFMWIHYQDPHGPYTPPWHFAKQFRDPLQEPWNLTVNTFPSGYGGIPFYQQLGANRDFYYYASQYDGEIRYQDEHFKRLVDALKTFGLYENAFIIFSSDHGEDMGEHNYFFTHGENLYNSLIHVPLIIKYGKELTGRRTDFVQHLDIVPTILNVLGLKVDKPFRGRDLRKQHGTRELFAEMYLPLTKFTIVLDGLKLIYTPFYSRHELFDVKTDPYEEHNLADDARYQEQVADLKVRLITIRGEDLLGLNVVKEPQELTDEEIEKLKSLGYVR